LGERTMKEEEKIGTISCQQAIMVEHTGKTRNGDLKDETCNSAMRMFLLIRRRSRIPVLDSHFHSTDSK